MAIALGYSASYPAPLKVLNGDIDKAPALHLQGLKFMEVFISENNLRVSLPHFI